MAVSCIDGSVIPFDTQENCAACFNSDYCTLVESTDVTELQFQLSEITGVNVLPEGDMLPQASGTTTSASVGKLIDAAATFATDGVLVGGVVYNSTDGTYHEISAIDSETQLSISPNIASGKDYVITNWDRNTGTWGTSIDYDGTLLTFSTSTTVLQLTNRLENGKYYRAKVTSTGNAIGSGRLTLQNGSGTVYFQFGADPTHTESVVFFQANGTSVRLVTGSMAGGTTISISELEIVEMSSLYYELRDCDNPATVYDSSSTVGISYNTDVQFQNNPNAQFYGMLKLAWDGYSLTPPQCFCLCVKDYGARYYNYISNGGFTIYSDATHATDWLVTDTGAGSWAFDGLTASHVAGVGINSNSLEQELQTPLNALDCHVVSFDYDSDNGFTVSVYYDTATTSNTLLEVVNKPLGAGTHTIDVSNIAITDLRFTCLADQEFSIDNVSIKLSDDCWDCSCLSSCISVATSHDSTNLFGCNMLFTGTCDNNAFGFNFEDLVFTNRMRLTARLRNSSYNEETEYYTKSTGEKILVYAEREKALELQVYEIPEGVHDALNLITLCDTFTIDGVEYVRIGEYAPNWRKSSDKAPVIIQVAKKTQNRFNTFS